MADFKKSESIKEIALLVEQAAADVVMLDTSDLPEMARFCKHLQELAVQIKQDSATCGGDSDEWTGLHSKAEDAALKVQNVILEDSSDPDADMQVVAENIKKLQAFFTQNGQVCDVVNNTVEEEDEAAIGSIEQETEDTKALEEIEDLPAGTALELPPGVDAEIFEAFIEQQDLVLPEMEREILGYESSGDIQHLAALRRLLHTMKGEAGVVGVAAMERLCHSTEDYLEMHEGAIHADLLLEVQDLLGVMVRACRGGEMLPRMDDVLVKLHQGESTNAADADHAGQVIEAAGLQAPVCEHPEGYPVQDKDLARDFVGESREHFEMADANLLKLEDEPQDSEAIGAVFRAFHTIKGVSGFMGLAPISDLAHKAETLLDDVRKDRREFIGTVVDVTFSGLDMLKAMVDDLEKVLATDCNFHVRPENAKVMDDLQAVLDGREPSPPADGIADDNRTQATFDEKSASQGAAAVTAEPAAVVTQKFTQSSTVKIDADKLDLLIDTIGEMVIAQSIVAQDGEIRSLRSERLEKNLAHLSKITRSLQDMSMAMRMVPVESVFQKMARLVRDLAKKGNKKVRLTMEGRDTELDRGMVEKLGDPLVHMIRNSVDHGIEATVQDRLDAGKPAEGNVTLRAYHKGGCIHIDISDDGRGLDREAIVAKAIEKGLIQNADNMSDQDVFSLIFQAGFSTAKQVSEISGRGVGMDVVRKNIESLRGNILIQSDKGKGTTFTLVLPLTMAIIDGMAVLVGNQAYIIPTLTIVESIRPEKEMITTVSGRGEMLKFRDTLLPLFRLSSLLKVASRKDSITEGIAMVLEDNGRQVALLVDEMVGQQQTVIKSLGAALGNVDGISGATIMADGNPGLILDVAGIVKMAGGG